MGHSCTQTVWALSRGIPSSFQIPVWRRRRRGNSGDPNVGTTGIALAVGWERKCMHNVCIFQFNSWFLCSILSCPYLCLCAQRYSNANDSRLNAGSWRHTMHICIWHNWTQYRHTVRFQRWTSVHIMHLSGLSPQIKIRTTNDGQFMLALMKGVQYIHCMFALLTHEQTRNTCAVLLWCLTLTSNCVHGSVPTDTTSARGGDLDNLD